MSNKVTNSKSIVTAIDAVIDRRLNNFRVATFAIITKINNNSTLNAKPLVAEPINVQGKKTYKDLPEIQNIPYLILVTPSVGDYCVLLHLDYGINSNQYLDTDLSNQIPEEIIDKAKLLKAKNPHNLNNCVAICGFKNISQDLNSPADDQYHLTVNSIVDEKIKDIQPGEGGSEKSYLKKFNVDEFVRINDNLYVLTIPRLEHNLINPYVVTAVAYKSNYYIDSSTTNNSLIQYNIKPDNFYVNKQINESGVLSFGNYTEFEFQTGYSDTGAVQIFVNIVPTNNALQNGNSNSYSGYILLKQLSDENPIQGPKSGVK